MLTFEDFKSAFDSLELGKKPGVAHASLKSFGEIDGGVETVLGALLSTLDGLLVPTFTYKTMITPEVGPPNNGLTYGMHRDLNRMAEPFRRSMPADKLMGTLPETLRNYPGAMRTAHPILSFSGVGVNDALNAQTLYDPFATIGVLAERGGWVMLMGVDHTVNTSIHYAEKMTGRRQFVRWALTKKRIVECPCFPGCSDGFEDIRPDLEEVTRQMQLGNSYIEAIPLQALFQAVQTRIKENPLALLCSRDECGRCDAVRNSL